MRLSRIVKLCAAIALAGSAAIPSGARAQDKEKIVAFVVDRSSPITDVPVDELRAMYLGKRKTWSDGTRVLPIDLERGPERDAVNARVLGMSQSDVERYWVEQRVRGAGAAPRVAATSFVVKLVSKVRGAVGYVPLSEVDDSVKVLKVGGVAPGSPGYPVVVR